MTQTNLNKTVNVHKSTVHICIFITYQHTATTKQRYIFQKLQTEQTSKSNVTSVSDMKKQEVARIGSDHFLYDITQQRV